MIRSFWCSIGTEKLLKSASRELSKVASIKLFGLDMFNTTAECIIDSLMKRTTLFATKRTCNWERNIFSLKLESDFGESEHFISNC